MSERRREIVEMAERLFSSRGYHATTMRDLARALDLKGGSLYSHIEGKEELLWRILERAATRFMASMEQAEGLDGSPGERLHEAIRGHVRVVTGDLDAATVYFHEWRALGEPRRGAFLATRNEYEGRLRALVAAAVAAGEYPPVDAKWGALLILSATNWLYQWYDPAGPLSPDEIADRLIEMLLAPATHVDTRRDG